MEEYADFMAATVGMDPTFNYEINNFAFDGTKDTAIIFATAMDVSHYAYVIVLDPAGSGKVAALAKIWNDQFVANTMISASRRRLRGNFQD